MREPDLGDARRQGDAVGPQAVDRGLDAGGIHEAEGLLDGPTGGRRLVQKAPDELGHEERGAFPVGAVPGEVGSVAVLAGEIQELLFHQCPDVAVEILVLAVLCSREIAALVHLSSEEAAQLAFDAVDVLPHTLVLGSAAAHLELQRRDPLAGGLQLFVDAWCWEGVRASVGASQRLVLQKLPEFTEQHGSRHSSWSGSGPVR
ncbi:hypothetical protein G3I34_02335 [Streptomyces sp. SID8014]|uniref:hypothetical protein n=1 Tax=Streptomyces sp. SID8014 TaxID=2706097 RepID=UPI0013BE5A6E|nr:hypothetical protein [Streptomyces sp. SID8014]NEC11165.1 hypothetical protein [Streptomyces sp. SID8014]